MRHTPLYKGLYVCTVSIHYNDDDVTIGVRDYGGDVILALNNGECGSTTETITDLCVFSENLLNQLLTLLKGEIFIAVVLYLSHGSHWSPPSVTLSLPSLTPHIL